MGAFLPTKLWLVLCLAPAVIFAMEQQLSHAVPIDSTGNSTKLFAFMLNRVYEYNLSFTILPHPTLDADGASLAKIINLRLIYLYFVNDYGGIDFFPFTSPNLHLAGKRRFWPETQVRLGYRVEPYITEFFRPHYFSTVENHEVVVFTRFTVLIVAALRA
jgi:hypothetical protein